LGVPFQVNGAGETSEVLGQRPLCGVYGEPFDPERFRSWTVFDRLKHASPAAAELKYWLAAGDKDFSGILSGTVRLHQELLERGIASDLRITSGGHTWELWNQSIDPALSWLSPLLDPGCATQTSPG